MDTVALVERTEAQVRLSLNGRIDAQNADEVALTIAGILSGVSGSALVFDCSRLKYISSAGLRIFLKLRKNHPSISMVEVSRDVYDIFEMTGFTEILDVERAYKRISVDGCEKIGEGANGAVYRIDSETIVKVYKRAGSLDAIRHERDVAKRALILGIPTAISYDIVRVGESYASVFELIDAKSFSQIIAAEPERIGEFVDMSVSVLKLLHGIEVPDGELPDQKLKALSWIEDVKTVLPSSMYDRIKELFSAIPRSNHVLHGDFHTKNLMLQNGEPLMIDMDTLCVGNPVYEFAAIYNACKGYGDMDKSRVTNFIGLGWDQTQHFWEGVLKGYLGTDDKTILKEAETKASVVAYLRLLRHTIRKEGADPARVNHYLDRLSELLPCVDSLAF